MAASSTHSATSLSVAPQARPTAFMACSGSIVCATDRALWIGSFIGVSGAVNGRISSFENPRNPASVSSPRRTDPQPTDSARRASASASCSSHCSGCPGTALWRTGRAVETTLRIRLSRGERLSESWTSAIPDSPSTRE